MSLKRGMTSIYLVVMMVVLVGCSNKVTQKELMNHDWKFVTEDENKDEEVTMVASFTKTSVILSFDASSMKSEASNEYEEYGESIAKTILSNINYKVDYELNGETIHLKNTDLGLDDDLTIKKDKKNVVLSSDKSDESVTLVPLDKKTNSSK